ncbi:MAG TPA: UDP-N-acetylmuramate dehydrogenase [Bacillales bacterium]|nr:UDP-N-acetylmuramate dehydrogenase [Bacillales bacterium]
MQQLASLLLEKEVGKVISGERLAKHTTMKVGGPADLFVEPSDMKGLETTFREVRKAGVPWRVIGRGSNLLVDDEGIEGVVIKLGRGMDHLEIDGEEVTVGGGYPLVGLAAVISRKGLSGLEFAGGIPGSVGGAVYMNAGAHGSDISKILKKAQILFEDGTVRWLTNEEMAFEYRTSILQKKPGICIAAVFQMKKGDREAIFGKMKGNKEYRRKTQPVDRCCGSVFRNPLPKHAGQLIESAGLKGHRIGGAEISPLHANFIVNVENAKARDVHELIQLIQHDIYEKYAVKLHTEVEMIHRKVR